jgi:hypothetical protein
MYKSRQRHIHDPVISSQDESYTWYIIFSFSCPTAVPLVFTPTSVQYTSCRSRLVQRTICDAASTTVRDFLSSASNPKRHLKQPFPNYVSDLPDSNLSFPPVCPRKCYDRPRPLPTTSLPNRHSHINLCTAVRKTQAHNILCRTVL